MPDICGIPPEHTHRDTMVVFGVCLVVTGVPPEHMCHDTVLVFGGAVGIPQSHTLWCTSGPYFRGSGLTVGNFR